MKTRLQGRDDYIQYSIFGKVEGLAPSGFSQPPLCCSVKYCGVQFTVTWNVEIKDNSNEFFVGEKKYNCDLFSFFSQIKYWLYTKNNASEFNSIPAIHLRPFRPSLHSFLVLRNFQLRRVFQAGQVHLVDPEDKYSKLKNSKIILLIIIVHFSMNNPGLGGCFISTA